MSFLNKSQSKQTSSSVSENTNNEFLKNLFGGSIQQGVNATGNLASLLGVGGDPQQGLTNYLQMAGYGPAMKMMQQGVTGQGAASGLLNSGATAKALQDRGAEINQGFTNNYLQLLSGLGNQGLQAGGLLGNTGQRSESNSSGWSYGRDNSALGSIGQAIGGVAKIGSIFSDRRLKRDIKLEGRRDDGLNVYSYRYVGDKKRHVGVMADEVAVKRPDALGPVVGGYATVNYGAI